MVLPGQKTVAERKTTKLVPGVLPGLDALREDLKSGRVVPSGGLARNFAPLNYFETPQNVVKWYHKINDNPNAAAPSWLDTKTLNLAYDFLKYKNKDLPEDKWLPVTPEDPVAAMYGAMAAPPVDQLSDYEKQYWSSRKSIMTGKSGKEVQAEWMNGTFWQDPQRVIRYYNTIKNMPPNWQGPNWISPTFLKQAYDIYKVYNAGKTPDHWEPLPDSHPAISFLKEGPVPPEETWAAWDQPKNINMKAPPVVTDLSQGDVQLAMAMINVYENERLQNLYKHQGLSQEEIDKRLKDVRAAGAEGMKFYESNVGRMPTNESFDAEGNAILLPKVAYDKAGELVPEEKVPSFTELDLWKQGIYSLVVPASPGGGDVTDRPGYSQAAAGGIAALLPAVGMGVNIGKFNPLAGAVVGLTTFAAGLDIQLSPEGEYEKPWRVDLKVIPALFKAIQIGAQIPESLIGTAAMSLEEMKKPMTPERIAEIKKREEEQRKYFYDNEWNKKQLVAIAQAGTLYYETNPFELIDILYAPSAIEGFLKSPQGAKAGQALQRNPYNLQANKEAYSQLYIYLKSYPWRKKGQVWKMYSNIPTELEKNPVTGRAEMGAAALLEYRDLLVNGMTIDEVYADANKRYGMGGFFNDFGGQMMFDLLNVAPRASLKIGAAAAKANNSVYLADFLYSKVGNDPLVDFLGPGLDVFYAKSKSIITGKPTERSMGIITAAMEFRAMGRTGKFVFDYKNMPWDMKEAWNDAVKVGKADPKTIKFDGSEMTWKDFDGVEHTFTSTHGNAPRISDLTPLERRIMGVNEEGVIIETIPYPESMTKLQKLVRLTPEAQALEYFTVYQDAVKSIVSEANDIESLIGILDSASKADPRAAQRADRAFMDTPVIYTVVDALKVASADKRIPEILAQWTSVKPWLASLNELGVALDMNPGKIVEMLATDAGIKELSIKVAGLENPSETVKIYSDPANIKKTLGKVFGEGKQDWHPAQFIARVIGAMSESVDQYLVERYHISPDKLGIRVSHFLKSVMSLMLLSNSVSYAVNNEINNFISRAAAGVSGYILPAQMEATFAEIGFTPTRFRVGIGLGGERNIDVITGKEGKPIVSAVARAKQGIGTELDYLAKSQQAVRSLSNKFGFMTKLSNWFEKQESEQALYIGFMRFWDRDRKYGVGITPFPKTLDTYLNQYPITKALIIDALETGKNMDQVITKMYSNPDQIAINVTKMIDDVVTKRLPKAPQTLKDTINETIGPKLQELLPKAKSVNDINMIFDLVESQIDNLVERMHGENLKKSAEQAATLADAEQFPFILDAYDKFSQYIQNEWAVEHFNEVKKVFEASKDLDATETSRLWREQNAKDALRFAQAKDRHLAMLSGIFKILHVDNAEESLILTSTRAIYDAWNGFYDRTQAARAKFFKTTYSTKEAKNTAYYTMELEIQEDYKRTYFGADKTPGEQGYTKTIDESMARLYEQRTGRPQAEFLKWRQEVMDIRDKMVADQLAVRDKAGKELLPAARYDLLDQFFNEEYRALITELEKKKRDGAKVLFEKNKTAAPEPEKIVPGDMEPAKQVEADIVKKTTEAESNAAVKKAETRTHAIQNRKMVQDAYLQIFPNSSSKEIRAFMVMYDEIIRNEWMPQNPGKTIDDFYATTVGAIISGVAKSPDHFQLEKYQDLLVENAFGGAVGRFDRVRAEVDALLRARKYDEEIIQTLLTQKLELYQKKVGPGEPFDLIETHENGSTFTIPLTYEEGMLFKDFIEAKADVPLAEKSMTTYRKFLEANHPDYFNAENIGEEILNQVYAKVKGITRTLDDFVPGIDDEIRKYVSRTTDFVAADFMDRDGKLYYFTGKDGIGGHYDLARKLGYQDVRELLLKSGWVRLNSRGGGEYNIHLTLPSEAQMNELHSNLKHHMGSDAKGFGINDEPYLNVDFIPGNNAADINEQYILPRGSFFDDGNLDFSPVWTKFTDTVPEALYRDTPLEWEPDPYWLDVTEEIPYTMDEFVRKSLSTAPKDNRNMYLNRDGDPVGIKIKTQEAENLPPIEYQNLGGLVTIEPYLAMNGGQYLTIFIPDNITKYQIYGIRNYLRGIFKHQDKIDAINIETPNGSLASRIENISEEADIFERISNLYPDTTDIDTKLEAYNSGKYVRKVEDVIDSTLHYIRWFNKHGEAVLVSHEKLNNLLGTQEKLAGSNFIKVDQWVPSAGILSLDFYGITNLDQWQKASEYIFKYVEHNDKKHPDYPFHLEIQISNDFIRMTFDKKNKFNTPEKLGREIWRQIVEKESGTKFRQAYQAYQYDRNTMVKLNSMPETTNIRKTGFVTHEGRLIDVSIDGTSARTEHFEWIKKNFPQYVIPGDMAGTINKFMRATGAIRLSSAPTPDSTQFVIQSVGPLSQHQINGIADGIMTTNYPGLVHVTAQIEGYDPRNISIYRATALEDLREGLFRKSRQGDAVWYQTHKQNPMEIAKRYGFTTAKETGAPNIPEEMHLLRAIKKYYPEKYGGMDVKQAMKDGVLYKMPPEDMMYAMEARAIAHGDLPTFPQFGDTTKGTFGMVDGKAVIRFMEAADFSTAIHEGGMHLLRTFLNPQHILDTESFLNVEIARLNKLKKDGKLSQEQIDSFFFENGKILDEIKLTDEFGKWTVASEEIFARAGERYFANDTTVPLPAKMRAVFKTIAEALQRVYAAFVGKDYEGSPLDLQVNLKIKMADGSMKSFTDIMNEVVHGKELATSLEEGRATLQSRPTGKTTFAFDPTDPNIKYNFQYKVVDLDELIPSNTDAFQPNEKYPAVLQPRERSTKTSQKQVIDIAAGLVPEKVLIDVSDLANGSPIIGDDLAVEGGNGRVLGFRMARESYPENWANYRQYLVAHAAEFGLKPEDVDAIANPVLVRERLDLPEGIDRGEFAFRTSKGSAAGFTPEEIAIQDATKWTPGLISAIKVGESDSIDAALRMVSNKEIVNKFVSNLTDTTDMFTADGELSAKGLQRIKASLFAAVFDSDAGRKLLRLFTENTDNNIKILESAIYANLPSLAKMEGKIKAGTINAEYSIADDLSALIEEYGRRKREKIPLGQEDLFGNATPGGKKLIEFFYNNARSRKAMDGFLQEYIDLVNKQPAPDQQSLIPMEVVPKDTLLSIAVEHSDLNTDTYLPTDYNGVIDKLAKPYKNPSLNKTIDRVVIDADGNVVAEMPVKFKLQRIKTTSGESATVLGYDPADANRLVYFVDGEIRKTDPVTQEFKQIGRKFDADLVGRIIDNELLFPVEDPARYFKEGSYIAEDGQVYQITDDTVSHDLFAQEVGLKSNDELLEKTGWVRIYNNNSAFFIDFRNPLNDAQVQTLFNILDEHRGYPLGFDDGKKFTRASVSSDLREKLMQYHKSANEYSSMDAFRPQEFRQVGRGQRRTYIWEDDKMKVLPEVASLFSNEGFGAIGFQNPKGTPEWYGMNKVIRAGDFLDLATDMGADKRNESMAWMKEQVINKGEKMAPPVLYVEWDKEGKFWRMQGHEGRHRAQTIIRLYGPDTEIPVYVNFFRLRGPDITPEMSKAPVLTERAVWDEYRNYQPKEVFRQVANPVGKVPPGSGPVTLDPSELNSEVNATMLRPLISDMRQKSIEQFNNRPLNGIPADSMPEPVKAELDNYLNVARSDMIKSKTAASAIGTAYRDNALLNYSRRFGFDDYLEMVMPYQFWFTRTMANWMGRMVERPALWALYAKYQEMQKKYEDDLPSRFQGRTRMPAPFLPQGFGATIFANPMAQIFPLSQAAEIPENIQRNFDKQENTTKRIINEQVKTGEITQEEADTAIVEMNGNEVWDAAAARGKEESNYTDPYSLISLGMSPAMWIDIPYKLATGNKEGISNLPMTRQGRALGAALQDTPLEGAGNLAEKVMAGPENVVRKWLDLPEYSGWYDYYVNRSISNMAVEGVIPVDQAEYAIAFKQGPAYEMGVKRANQELSLRVPGTALIYALKNGMSFTEMPVVLIESLFPGGILQEGEMKYRGLYREYKAAWDDLKQGDLSAIKDFFKKHPEYSTRLAIFEEPEAQMRNFIIDKVWSGFMGLSAADKKNVTQQLGPQFQEEFLGGSAPYDNIPTDRLSYWATYFGASLPMKPEPKQGAAPVQQPVQQYQPLAQDVQITQPDLWDSATNAAITEYERIKDRDYPNIDAIQKGFYAYPEGSLEQKKYLQQFKQLKQFWGWKDDYRGKHPELEPYFAKKSMDFAATGQTVDYTNEVVKLMTTDLVNQLSAYYYRNIPLAPGAYAELRYLWEKAGKPGGTLLKFIDNYVKPGFVQ